MPDCSNCATIRSRALLPATSSKAKGGPASPIRSFPELYVVLISSSARISIGFTGNRPDRSREGEVFGTRNGETQTLAAQDSRHDLETSPLLECPHP